MLNYLTHVFEFKNVVKAWWKDLELVEYFTLTSVKLTISALLRILRLYGQYD